MKIINESVRAGKTHNFYKDVYLLKMPIVLCLDDKHKDKTKNGYYDFLKSVFKYTWFFRHKPKFIIPKSIPNMKGIDHKR